MASSTPPTNQSGPRPVTTSSTKKRTRLNHSSGSSDGEEHSSDSSDGEEHSSDSSDGEELVCWVCQAKDPTLFSKTQTTKFFFKGGQARCKSCVQKNKRPAPYEITDHHNHAGASDKIRDEIKLCQSTPEFLIQRAPMLRLIREMVAGACTKINATDHFRMTQGAIDALQTAAEAEVVEKFVYADAARAHRGKATVTTDDMRLVPFLLSHGQSEPPVFRAETKRVEKSVEKSIKKDLQNEIEEGKERKFYVPKGFKVEVEYQKSTVTDDGLEDDSDEDY
jgi:histone H3/H4